MHKPALDLKKVSAEHCVSDKDYTPISLLSNACLRMEDIVDIIENTSSKLQETLDCSALSDTEDVMDEWEWCEKFF
jgi:hypothetical protein